MAIHSYYFNSRIVNGEHDRTYNAEEMCEYFKGIISNGVLANPSNNLQVTATNGMNILIKAGEGWISGHKILLDADETLTLEAADTALNRIDRVVFALNRTERLMQIYIKKGTLSSTPVAPELINTDNLVELSLATIKVNKNVSGITQSLITDTRYDTNVCGIVHSLIEQLDTSTTFAQYDDAFNTWFTSLKEDLVSNTVFIEKRAVYTTSVENEKTIAIPDSLSYGDALDVLHVYLNGFRLIEGIEYTKTDTSIIFTNALSKAGTPVEITNWKTMGSDDVQSVVAVVSSLQTKMTQIQKYRYDCTGTNDNVNINNLLANFYDGTGEFAGANSYGQLRLEVHGTINLGDASNYISTTNCKGFIALEKSSNKRVILDLSNANIVATLTKDKGINAIIDILSSNFTIINPKITATLTGNEISIIKTDGDVEGGHILVTNNDAKSIIGVECVSTNTNQTINNTYVWMNATGTTSNANNIYGFVGREEETETEMPVKFINCTARISAATNTYYILRAFKGFGIYDTCFAYCYNVSHGEYAITTGFEGGGIYNNCSSMVTGNRLTAAFSGFGIYNNCKAHAASSTTNSTNAVGYHINGEATNCEGIGRNVGNGSGYGFLLGDNTKPLKLVNCRAYGYCASGQSSNSNVFAHGIVADAITNYTLICIGCECPTNARQYLTQKGSILLKGTSSGVNASLIGNVVYSAIKKHTGSNVSESGTIVVA